ncbi:M10 family metallopeptidase [Nodosilinea sp. LEGE 06152]|uniref:M10 family metallopeptidase n=1 Tax=Nodosilinea sp. LEGE 06152 TaxID=2777966 RepID=UPI00187E5DA3|nr:M10 family metallopeptidase [Nodosilinea sp. LEGE 06152]MBE9158986.1 M10 family metallopeptidase [Nodosilinea sp. LEGE 06152]
MGTNPLWAADWGVLAAELPEFDELMEAGRGDPDAWIAMAEGWVGAIASSTAIAESNGPAIDAVLKLLERPDWPTELSPRPRLQTWGPTLGSLLKTLDFTAGSFSPTTAGIELSGEGDRLTDWGDATHLRACACRQCQSAVSEGVVAVDSAEPSSSQSGVDALLSDYRFAAGSNITFSFVNSLTAPSYNSLSNERVSEVSDPIKTSVRTILKSYIEPLINLTFTEVAESPGSFGQMRLMFSNLGGSGGYAYAYYPDTTGFYSFGSDVHLSDRYLDPTFDPYNNFASGPGSHGYTTLIHEIGHALGLKHPGNYNADSSGEEGPYLPTSTDHLGNTVMTYNFGGFAPATLMPLDIAALRSMYGSKAFNADDTVYRFTNTHAYTADGSPQTAIGGAASQRITLADSGGVDQLVFSALPFSESGYRFDLQPGGSLSTRADFDSATGLASRGTWLSLDTTIENVINSSSDDLIIANGAANVFGGYDLVTPTGNDVIVGATSRDLVNLTAFSSANVTQSQRGNDRFLDLGTGRSITLRDYFLAPAEERVRVQFAQPSAALASADDLAPSDLAPDGLGSTTDSIGVAPPGEADLFRPDPWVATGLPEPVASGLG